MGVHGKLKIDVKGGMSASQGNGTGNRRLLSLRDFIPVYDL